MKELTLIKKEVEKHFKVDIMTNTRRRQITDARGFFYKCSKDLLKRTSYPEIGNYVGKTHATIINGHKQINNIIEYDAKYKKDYLTLRRKCIKRLKMANPFEKYLTKEDKLQRAVMDYIALQYPNVYCIHVANEGKRSHFERYKFKYLGGKAGVPDVLIFKQNEFKAGLAIELKVGYNKPTESQLNALKSLENANWKAEWTNTFDKAKEIIDSYMSYV